MEILSFDMESDWLSDWETVHQHEADRYHWTDWDWDSDRVPAVSNQSESRYEKGGATFIKCIAQLCGFY